eukprot:UN10237
MIGENKNVLDETFDLFYKLIYAEPSKRENMLLDIQTSDVWCDILFLQNFMIFRFKQSYIEDHGFWTGLHSSLCKKIVKTGLFKNISAVFRMCEQLNDMNMLKVFKQP